MNVNELPQYKCHKVVRAGKILATAHNPNEDAVFLDVDGVVNKWLSTPAGWLNKHNPDIGGYLVAYEDGYLSYSPAAAFEAGYRLLEPTEPLTGDGTKPDKVADSTDPRFGKGYKYRKKAVVIDAVQWHGGNLPECKHFLGGSYLGQRAERHPGGANVIMIKTLEGQHIASLNDYLIRGIKGEHYACKPDIFAATYEPADATASTDKEAGDVSYLYPCKGGEGLAFVEGALPHQVLVIEEYNQLYKRHVDLMKFFDTDLYRSLSVEERNRLKEQSLFMAEYQRVLLERIRAF